MKKQYRFSLQRHTYSRRHFSEKVVTVFADSGEQAMGMIRENFPDWQVSMFWVAWPFRYE